ncbi:antitoxin Xre/MbcA/ParS toxin-binding domain-containing protein [Reyranella sp.]|uniref:antitoxin Xre/MbcA/ParS toxin-binding domain-containing protein n=1 Tax=Reyranella sp. TaxID=1929291 RepID=UPI0025DE071A|nr:antitoxin Xre/MbcA/ParS toxin-binding domain-containing protein [Reyranella sp.]
MATKKALASEKTARGSRTAHDEERARHEFAASSFFDSKGLITVDRVADSFGFSRAQLAATAGLSGETLLRPDRAAAPKAQARLKEMLEIVERIAEWAGGRAQAMAWYRAQPLPAFGGRTAESLVKDGMAADVRDYLDHVALGGFA